MGISARQHVDRGLRSDVAVLGGAHAGECALRRRCGGHAGTRVRDGDLTEYLRGKQLVRIRGAHGAVHAAPQPDRFDRRPFQAEAKRVHAALRRVVRVAVAAVQDQFLCQRPPLDERHLELREDLRHVKSAGRGMRGAGDQKVTGRIGIVGVVVNRFDPILGSRGDAESGVRERAHDPVAAQIAGHLAIGDGALRVP